MENNNLNNQDPFQKQDPNQNTYQQNTYQQNTYQQPYQDAYQPDNAGLEEPVSFGDWMVSLLIMCIPCVNIVMMFIWAFGSGTKKSKSNFFKASLVWTLIWTVLSVIIVIAFSASLIALLGTEGYY